ncbi:MAG: hemerythrin domain-containing protein [Rubrivivax sp.]|nr:hemerythrin domain-containing protein [Rubrivivax sp.]
MTPTQGELDIDDDDDEAMEAGTTDALDLLQADHDEVQQLFEDYESLLDDEAPEADREALARQICALLTVHATLEEELLYPAARDGLDSSRLVDAATIEHATARALINEIESMQASDALFDARVTVLGEYVRHHVEEEEEELLPQLAQAGVDMDELGAQLAARKEELMAEMGIEGA